MERSAWLRMSASALAPPADGVLLLDDGGQLLAHELLDLADHRRAGLAHAGDPQRDVGLHSLGQLASTWAASTVCRLAITNAIVCGDSVRRNADDLLRRRAAQELEGPHLDDRGQPAEQLLGALGAERALEHLAREVDAAGDVRRAACVSHSGELAEDRLGRLLSDRAQLGHLQREALDLLLAHVLHHARGALGAERGHQNRRLAPPAAAHDAPLVQPARAPVDSSAAGSSIATGYPSCIQVRSCWATRSGLLSASCSTCRRTWSPSPPAIPCRWHAGADRPAPRLGGRGFALQL